MQFFAGLLISFFIFSFSLSSLYSQDNQESQSSLPSGAQLGFYLFKYEKYLQADVMGIYHKKKIYIPLNEILNQVRIFNEFDFKNKIINGYINSPDSSFTFDFINRFLKYKDKTVELIQDDFIIQDIEIYILPEKLNNCLPLILTTSQSRLEILLKTPVELPYFSEYKRQYSYNFINDKQDQRYDTSTVLKFDKSRDIFNFGLINYYTLFNTMNGNNSFSYSIKSGFALLGGDFSLQTYGYTQDFKTLSSVNNYYSWRYFVGDNNILSQILIGDLSTGGFRYNSLPSKFFLGAQITNDLIKPINHFTDYVIEEKIEPGWQVELYRDGLLVNQQVTDEQGRYRFVFPIYYGNSNIELKFYGKHGEFRSKKELINIPSQILSPGRVIYALSAGRERAFNRKFVEAKLDVGLTSWFTNSFNLEFFENDQMPSILNSMNIQLLNDMIMSLDYFHDNYTQLKINYWPFDAGSYELLVTNFSQKSKYSYGNMLNQISLNTSFPRFIGSNLNINIRNSVNEFRNYYSNYLDINTSIMIIPLSLNFSYNNSSVFYKTIDTNENFYRHNLTSIISYNTPGIYGTFSIFGGYSINLSNSYDISNNRFGATSIDIGKVIVDDVSLNLRFSRNLFQKDILYTVLTIRSDFSLVRSVTEGKFQGSQNYIASQEFSGNIGFIPEQGELLFSNPTIYSNIGVGAANIRVYLDDNINGEYDEGEKVIPNIRVRIPNASIDRRSGGNSVQVYNLTAYGRYNVYLDPKSIQNPLWIPAFTEFAFIADPNVYKPIDIPCYAGAVIEGRVQRNEADSLSGQAGVKVHIMSRDSSYRQAVPVFSDGSFYYMGVPPGDYIAFVDSLQMAILDVKPAAPYSEFKVKRTTEGDYVGNLNFELIPNRIVRKRPSEPVQKAPEDGGLRRPADTSAKDKPLASAPSGAKAKDKKAQQATPPPALEIEANKLKVFTYKATKDVLLTSEMRRYLDAVAGWMEANPRCEVSIVGHTDNFGTMEATQELSEMRATTAANYLAAKGIDRGRILPSGEGSRNPISSNMTPEGRRKNRRIEITVIE